MLRVPYVNYDRVDHGGCGFVRCERWVLGPRRLHAGDTVGSDDGRMRDPGRYVEPVSGCEIDALAGWFDDELNAALCAVQDLVVRVRVSGVDFTGRVRPPTRREVFLSEACF